MGRAFILYTREPPVQVWLKLGKDHAKDREEIDTGKTEFKPVSP
jgi:hypothetical protein